MVSRILLRLTRVSKTQITKKKTQARAQATWMPRGNPMSEIKSGNPKRNSKANMTSRSTVGEASKKTWYQTKHGHQKSNAYRGVNACRAAMYQQRDPYFCILANMPNNSSNYHSYQRLKGEERPVESLMLNSVYKRSFQPTQYMAETVNFYRFATEDVNGEAFWYFIHKSGYLPDPLSTIAPEERKQDRFLNRIFPQFARAN